MSCAATYYDVRELARCDAECSEECRADSHSDTVTIDGVDVLVRRWADGRVAIYTRRSGALPFTGIFEGLVAGGPEL